MKFMNSFFAIGLLLTPLAVTSPISEGDEVAKIEFRSPESTGTSKAESEDDLLKRAGSWWCPDTNNGAYGHYRQTEFRQSRVDKTLSAAASVLESKGPDWQPKSRDYPHVFNNHERIFSNCRGTLYEYPILPDQTWKKGGGVNVKNIPDRLVFSGYWASNNRFVEQVCGVMRHGPGRSFLECTYY